MIDMKEMTCIVCPNGCKLEVTINEDQIMVQGNLCPKGEHFAVTELRNPMRTISSTVATIFPAVPALPVRVSGEIPKEEIFHVMEAIHQVVIDRVVERNTVIIQNVCNLGVDVIATSNILKTMGE